MLTPFTACTLPKYASSDSTRIRGIAAGTTTGWLTRETSSVAVM
jgi:hypothetical protein